MNVIPVVTTVLRLRRSPATAPRCRRRYLWIRSWQLSRRARDPVYGRLSDRSGRRRRSWPARSPPACSRLPISTRSASTRAAGHPGVTVMWGLFYQGNAVFLASIRNCSRALASPRALSLSRLEIPTLCWRSTLPPRRGGGPRARRRVRARHLRRDRHLCNRCLERARDVSRPP